MALTVQIEQVAIQAEKGSLEGVLWLPDDPIAVVLFAAGRGGRIRPPNDYVGSVLRSARVGTLWLDLLVPQDTRGEEPLNLDMLTRRLSAACDWLQQHPVTRDLPLGLFAASNGAAAALELAASRGSCITAVVLRSGHPDMAETSKLAKIVAPTLLIVGSLDERSVGVNRAAFAALRCKKRLEIIPGATHSFEEPGSLEVVARLARGWFLQNARIKHV